MKAYFLLLLSTLLASEILANDYQKMDKLQRRTEVSILRPSSLFTNTDASCEMVRPWIHYRKVTSALVALAK